MPRYSIGNAARPKLSSNARLLCEVLTKCTFDTESTCVEYHQFVINGQPHAAIAQPAGVLAFDGERRVETKYAAGHPLLRSTSEAATPLGWACWLVEAVAAPPILPCEPRPTRVPWLKRASIGTSPLASRWRAFSRTRQKRLAILHPRRCKDKAALPLEDRSVSDRRVRLSLGRLIGRPA